MYQTFYEQFKFSLRKCLFMLLSLKNKLSLSIKFRHDYEMNQAQTL